MGKKTRKKIEKVSAQGEPPQKDKQRKGEGKDQIKGGGSFGGGYNSQKKWAP